MIQGVYFGVSFFDDREPSFLENVDLLGWELAADPGRFFVLSP